MRGVIASLFVFLMIFSFAVAGSSSSIQTNFYVQDEEVADNSGGDATDTSSLQTEWLSRIIYWSMIIIAFAIFVKLLKIAGRKKSKSKKSKKRSRRKK